MRSENLNCVKTGIVQQLVIYNDNELHKDYI